MTKATTPRGFRDALFDETAERAALVGLVADAFASWGYRGVETPVLERYRTLEAGAGASIEGAVLTVVDSDGSLLALRPEMTVPIARLVATRLEPGSGPHRISYVTEVFREQATLRGQARQFEQAGVELIGPSGPAADAEIVAVMSAALSASGLADFTVALGSVGVLRDLLEASGMPDDWQRDAMRAAHRRDLVGLGELAADPGVDARVSTAMVALPSIRGGREAIERCRALTQGLCDKELDALESTWDLLSASGLGADLVVDFGVLRDLDYYTGLVVEAYVPGLGVAVGGGGRYDDVLGTLGDPSPAAGFALGVERLHIAATAQGCLPFVRGIDALVGGATPPDAFRAAALLREAGWRVALASDTPRSELAVRAVAGEIRTALWAEGSSIGSLGPDGAVSWALDTADLPEPPTLGGCQP